MFSLIKKNKNIFFSLILLLFLPIIIPLLSTIIEILFNLGVHLGTLARCVNEGICCK